MFTIDVEDELVGREIPTSPGRNYFENAGETSREGVEFSWIANSDRPHRDDGQLYVLGLQVLAIRRNGWRRQHRSQRQRDPGHRREPAVRRVRVSRPPRLVRCGRGAVRRRAIRRQRATTSSIDDYTLTSFRFGYDAELGSAGGFSLSPFVGINNLTDETYTANVRLNAAAARYFEPGPGRNAYAGVTLDWKFR